MTTDTAKLRDLLANAPEGYEVQRLSHPYFELLTEAMRVLPALLDELEMLREIIAEECNLHGDECGCEYCETVRDCRRITYRAITANPTTGDNP